MNNSLRNMFIFVAGALLGSVTTWFLVKDKYEQLANEEIKSVKETFSKREKVIDDCKALINTTRQQLEEEPVVEGPTFTKEKPSLTEYAARIKHYNEKEAVEEESEEEYDEPEEDHSDGRPYVINPDEYAWDEDHEKITLCYFQDGYLALWDDDELVEDVDNNVGLESLNHFGEYENDVVYVRNDRLMIDYEICKDNRKYTDVIKTRPHPMED